MAQRVDLTAMRRNNLSLTGSRLPFEESPATVDLAERREEYEQAFEHLAIRRVEFAEMYDVQLLPDGQLYSATNPKAVFYDGIPEVGSRANELTHYARVEGIDFSHEQFQELFENRSIEIQQYTRAQTVSQEQEQTQEISIGMGY